MNMRSGEPDTGSIANSLFTVALNQIWRDYGIPLRNTASAYSYSKKIDYQNGTERVIPALLSALSGATSIFFHGGVFCELTHSPIQAILDDDVAGMIGRFIEGVEVSDESLALKLIHEIGPVPGQFIDTKHTMNWWKKETYMKKCSDSLTYPEWINGGKNDCIYYAKKRMEKILSEHELSKKLSSEQEEEINIIIKEAEAFYRKKGELK
jgi:trimethylamine--corrinoid protein Co-methyltransferase